MGIRAKPHPPADESVLKLGRGNTSCKECLPLILTTGSLLNYIQNHKRNDEIVIYFMTTGSGPCRFGQYFIFMEDLIKRLKLPDTAILTLTSENSYLGMDNKFERRAWWAVIVSDVMEDIRSMLLANAANPQDAMVVFNRAWSNILQILQTGNFKALAACLTSNAQALGGLALKRPTHNVPVVSLTGEIFVRRDGLSRQYIVEQLAEKEIATICSPVAEWVLYAEYLVEKGLADPDISLMEKMRLKVRNRFMRKYERIIRNIMATSGLVSSEPLDIQKIINHASAYISPQLTGEAILTVGSSLLEIALHVCGVIAIGPFGCMPNRLSEAILNEIMKQKDKLTVTPGNRELKKILEDLEALPFLAIESDGSPFPQLINAKLEAFCLRAERLNKRMLAVRKNGYPDSEGHALDFT
jgi:predicted nucleotide-binding protein (sugar kinase/HSP70/actin superfamily)